MTSIDSALTAFRRRLRASRQRVLIWVCGELEWCRAQLAGPLAECVQGRGVLLSDQSVAGLQPNSARQAAESLGQTLDFAIVDAFSGFNPNAFGQLCGAVEGGGCLILMTPEPQQWMQFADPEYASLCVEPYRPEQLEGHYLTHLVQMLQHSEQRVLWAQGCDPVFPATLPPVSMSAAIPYPCRSSDQADAVAHILRVAGHRHQPLVLSADRGRGKSAALGIAAAQLLGEGKRVAVTAISRQAIAALLERVAELAPEVDGQLVYYRPDELLQAQIEADVLLVDEAAAIPTPVLTRLLLRYSRVVFATTLHGYEGNGQGFALRFLRLLRKRFPKCQEYRLTIPIRWAGPDPLEQLSNRMLLLDVDVAMPVGDTSPAEIERVPASVLATDTALLRSVFGLLVLAHYRTTPGDLRILLDSPNVMIYVMRRAGVPVACALIAREGPLAKALADAVWEGRRRPRGHLLPQTLIAQEGWSEVAPWRAWRVVRIAVHPDLQQQGLGQQLLRQIEQDACAECVDYLGASFAASEDLLRFWQGSGFVPLRLGEQRDPVAGTHALLVLKPLSAAVVAWLPEARNWYRQSVLQRLPVALQDLEAERLPALLHGTVAAVELSAAWRERVRGFTRAQRTLESSLLPLTMLLQASVHHWDRLSLTPADQRLLCGRILRQQPVAAITEPAGRRAQLERLRHLCDILLSCVTD